MHRLFSAYTFYQSLPMEKMYCVVFRFFISILIPTSPLLMLVSYHFIQNPDKIPISIKIRTVDNSRRSRYGSFFHPTFRLLAEGRFEILTGGWVMADEASTHVYALLDQLMQGQQWLKTQLS